MLLAQGWPANYGGVMLQAFYWDSFADSQWLTLEQQADELASSFDLVWIPQSGNCGGTSMGYDDLYWFNNYNSSFGSEEQLRSMISTFKGKGIKTIADVVINHRRNVSNWVDFPTETYNGVTYEMKSTDICANDDGGKTKTWATQNGYSLSTNNDTGEGWDGMRDLDHKSENVQTIVKAYLNFLKNDLGYAGFRYDMVKGYSPSFTGMYNTASQPEFSVGECWDGTNTIKNWIEGTRVDSVIQSAAFDFQFRYTVRNAANNGNWSRLSDKNDGNWPLVSNNQDGGKYRRYAVTFVENHDTEWRSNGERNDPLLKDTLAANAFLLAMPGTPCVFMKHWQAYPADIKAMIAVRKACGINSQSTYEDNRSVAAVYSGTVDNRLRVVVGNTAIEQPDASAWVKVLSGHHYAYYMSVAMNTPWASLASGIYEGEQQVLLSAVTADANAQVVYQIDNGSQQQVSGGTTVTLPVGTATLKVWLSSNPDNAITRTYIIKEKEEEPPFVIPGFCTVADGEVCAFFEAPASWTSTIKCWAWDSKGNYTGGTWPGVACTYVGTRTDGGKVWKWTWNGQYTTSGATQPTGIIFSSNGSPQTKDLEFHNGGYYNEAGVLQGIVTGIRAVVAGSASRTSSRIYTLGGQRVGSMRHGVHVVGGRKVVVK
jgi:alpha-amylase